MVFGQCRKEEDQQQHRQKFKCEAYNKQTIRLRLVQLLRLIMDCIFCKIIKKELPADIVYQDETIIAFNDRHPCAPIHQLIVPKKHIATLNDLTEDDTLLAGNMLQVARHLAKKAQITQSGYRAVFNCNKDGGQEVFHLHLHLLGGRVLLWPPG
ncbi:MAG: histidine triad family protein [Pseudomonadota bacterium]|nr:histidine triad family protein [Pseudomonadota bacterium]